MKMGTEKTLLRVMGAQCSVQMSYLVLHLKPVCFCEPISSPYIQFKTVIRKIITCDLYLGLILVSISRLVGRKSGRANIIDNKTSKLRNGMGLRWR